MAIFVVASSFCCLCLSVGNWGTNYTESRCMFKAYFIM
jgi:hypothetical protein